MADVFISYAREDRERAGSVAHLLERDGWSVWWDRRIVAGESFDQAIERELERARCVVVLWSEVSIASEWVKNEAALAAERGVLVPVVLDRVRPPLEFRRKQTVDLAGWNGDPGHEGFQVLRNGVAAKTGRMPDAAPLPSADRTAAGSAWSRRWIPGVAAIVVIALGLGVWRVLGPGADVPTPGAGATRATQRPVDLAALVAGTYSGAVVSDARGGSRSDVTVTVARMTGRRVRVTSDYARLGSVDVELDRVGDSVQSTDAAILAVDLSKTPPSLVYNPDGEAAYAGEKQVAGDP